MESDAPDPVPKPLDHLAHCGSPGDAALILRSGSVSYAELDQRVGRLAAWLARCANEGDRVASWAAKGELSCLLPLAAARAGLVHVPINPLLKRAQAAYIIADSGSRLLIGTAARLRTFEPGDVPNWCTCISEEEGRSLWFEIEDPLDPSDHCPETLAAILYTSGSTGQPKGVMLSHANMWLGAVSVAHYLRLAKDDTTLAVLPLSFDYGQSQLLSTWYAGGRVVPLDYLFPRDVVTACARHSVTTLAAVPPLWTKLLEAEWTQEACVEMRRLTNSGGALSRELVKRLRTTFPDADLYPMYGLTEAFRSTYLDPSCVDTHPTSMGSAVPFAEVMVVRADGTPCETGEEGELVHCGPLVAKGYWQNPQKTAARFRPAPAMSQYGGTAVWSGDRVTRDADGLLYFVGRRDAMIKSSGNRISPQEIETAAMATGLVREAVALGKPDTALGQAIHLVARPAAGGAGDTEGLLKALAHELPRFMLPHVVHWMDELPRNPNGKIDRTSLSKEYCA